MRPLSLHQKRLVAAIYLVVFLFMAGNQYLEWGIFGQASEAVLLILAMIGILAMMRFGPLMIEEIEAHNAARREAEDAAERMRDKSSDAVESERLRRDIGIPPNTSLERTRED